MCFKPSSFFALTEHSYRVRRTLESALSHRMAGGPHDTPTVPTLFLPSDTCSATKRFSCVGRGVGGIDELSSSIDDSQVLWGLVKVTIGSGALARTKVRAICAPLSLARQRISPLTQRMKSCLPCCLRYWRSTTLSVTPSQRMCGACHAA